MIQLRIKESRRTFQCDVAGCRNRTYFLITKRDDVASRPLHLCRDCIRGLASLLDDLDGVTATAPASEEPETVTATAPETTIITVNVGDRSGDAPEEAAPKTAARKRRTVK